MCSRTKADCLLFGNSPRRTAPGPSTFTCDFLTRWKTAYLERHGGIVILWNLPRQQHGSLHDCFDMKIFCKHCWKRKNSVFKPLLKTMSFTTLDHRAYARCFLLGSEREAVICLPVLEHSLKYLILTKISPFSPFRSTLLCFPYLRTWGCSQPDLVGIL